MTVVIIVSLATYPITTSAPPLYSHSLRLLPAHSGQQTVLISTQAGYQMPYIGERVSTALLLNMLYQNLTAARQPPNLRIIPDSNQFHPGSQFSIGLQLELSTVSSGSDLSLTAFLVSPFQLISSTYPVNSTVVGSTYYQYPAVHYVQLSNFDYLNTTEVSALQSGSISLAGQIPPNNASLGEWELFVFLSSPAQTGYTAYDVTSFSVLPPPTVSPLTTDAIGLSNLVGLLGLFGAVYEASRRVGLRILTATYAHKELIKENAVIFLTLIALLAFLILRYVIPLL